MSEMNMPSRAGRPAEALPAKALPNVINTSGFLFYKHSLPPLLIQYWQTVLRRRYLIAGIIGGCLAVGLIVTLLMAPLYTASTKLEISREQKNVTNVQGVLPEQGGRDLEFYATQYALLKAESLAQRVVRRLKLAERPDFFAAHGTRPAGDGDAAGSGQGEPAPWRKERERQALDLLLKNVQIAPIRTSSLVDVEYTSRSPVLSAEIANAWTQEFIGSTMDRQYTSTADARRFLEGRLDDLRARVEQSEREVVTYASDKGIVTLDTVRDGEGRTQTQRTLATADLEALNQALMSARAERIEAQSKLSAGPGESSPEALNDSVIASLRPKRAEVAAEYARMLTQFEPGYPAAQALKNQLDSLDAAIAREVAHVNSSNRQAYRQALAREKQLEARVAELKMQFDRQRRDSIQYNIYQREADTNRQLYDALLQRYKEIGVAGTVGASNITVVDAAKVPTAPSAPHLPVNLAIALLIGLGLAAVTVFGLEQIDEGIRNPADVEQLLDLPLLGHVPLADHEPQYMLGDPKSYLSEAYFSVRTTLALATSHGFPKSLMVTSSQPGEGKSITALSLAVAIGRTGKSVLLIDGDMRAPSVHKLVQGDNSEGLSNILAGEDDYASLIVKTEMKGVSVLPAGPMPPSAAELLSTDRITGLLSDLLKQYDHIVVDSPPVIGIADAPLIGAAVEGCIFIVENQRVPVRSIRNALQRFMVSHGHVFGVVVTKVDTSRYSYGYGYGHDYDYGHEARERISGKRNAA